jgi:hypothetical protein
MDDHLDGEAGLLEDPSPQPYDGIDRPAQTIETRHDQPLQPVKRLLAAWWANHLRRGAWTRGDRTHGELGLHLTAEFVTAGLLLASGRPGWRWALPRTPG